MGIYIHEIQLQGEDEFSERFNYVGRLWQWANEDGISEEERGKRLKEHWQAKYCLEQGLPIAYRNDIPTDF